MPLAELRNVDATAVRRGYISEFSSVTHFASGRLVRRVSCHQAHGRPYQSFPQLHYLRNPSHCCNARP